MNIPENKIKLANVVHSKHVKYCTFLLVSRYNNILSRYFINIH